MKFGTDIDGCLAKGTVEHIVSKLNYKFGTDYDIDRGKSKNYWFTDLWPDVTDKEIWDTLTDCDYDNLEVYYPEAIEYLDRIHSHADIIAITTRCLEAPNIYQRTKGWLDKYKIPHEMLLISFNKGEDTRILGLDYMVEDSPQNALDCAEEGAKTFLIDYPYNRDTEHERIVRVRDWHDIYDAFMDDISVEIRNVKAPYPSLRVFGRSNETERGYGKVPKDTG